VVDEKNLYTGMKVGRPDSSVAKQTPDLVYLNSPPQAHAEAT
jgi:hypothetical protein